LTTVYFICSVSSNNVIHLKWYETIVIYTLTHQLNRHSQALLSNTSWWTNPYFNVTVEITVAQVK